MEKKVPEEREEKFQVLKMAGVMGKGEKINMVEYEEIQLITIQGPHN